MSHCVVSTIGRILGGIHGGGSARGVSRPTRISYYTTCPFVSDVDLFEPIHLGKTDWRGRLHSPAPLASNFKFQC